MGELCFRQGHLILREDILREDFLEDNTREDRERIGMKMKGLKTFSDLMREEEGMGTVEIILIIVVLVGLVLIFKEQITEVVNSIFKKITSQTNKV